MYTFFLKKTYLPPCRWQANPSSTRGCENCQNASSTRVNNEPWFLIQNMSVWQNDVIDKGGCQVGVNDKGGTQFLKGTFLWKHYFLISSLIWHSKNIPFLYWPEKAQIKDLCNPWSKMHNFWGYCKHFFFHHGPFLIPPYLGLSSILKMLNGTPVHVEVRQEHEALPHRLVEAELSLTFLLKKIYHPQLKAG